MTSRCTPSFSTLAALTVFAAVATACGSGSSTTGTTSPTASPLTSAATTVVVTASQQSEVTTTLAATTTSPQTTTAPDTTAPQTTTAPTTAPATIVGHVTNADGGSVGRPPQRPQKDDPLHSGDPVNTGTAELVEFALNRKITGCKLFGNSQVTVAPQADVLLSIGSGTVLCRTSTKPGKETLQIAGRPVTVSDPVFLVEAGDGSAVTVHIVQGAVGVKAADGWHAYGAGQVVSWSGPGTTGALSSGGWGDISELPEIVQADVTRYQKVVAGQTGTITYPAVSPSSVLGKQVAASKVLSVQVDTSTESDHTAFEMTSALLGEMATRWAVAPRIVAADAAGVVTKPGGPNGPNLVVTPRPAKGALTVPLFATPEGVAWYVVVAPGDKAGAASIASFLRTLLATTCLADNPGQQAPLGQSCYEQRYRRVYDSARVPLDVLAGLLGVA